MKWPLWRVIISGSRTFRDYKLLARKMDLYTIKFRRIEVILGGMKKGADGLGFKWAMECWWRAKLYHPDWDKYGKAAGVLRNEEMAKVGDVLVAFWDGSSPGTTDMIARARKYGIPTKIVRF